MSGTQTRADDRPLELRVTRVDSLDRDGIEADRVYGGFFDQLSIEELATRQRVAIPRSLADLRSDWLDDESLDDLLNDRPSIRP